MDYKLRKAEPRDVSDILRLVKVDDHKPVNIYNIGPVRITCSGSYDREGLSRPWCGMKSPLRRLRWWNRISKFGQAQVSDVTLTVVDRFYVGFNRDNNYKIWGVQSEMCQ